MGDDGSCNGCDFMDAFFIDEIQLGDFDPRTQSMKDNGTCLIVDDSGCDLVFSYGYGDEEQADKSLRVWAEYTQHICPPLEVENHITSLLE